MTNKTYRTILGAILLVSLYVEIEMVIYIIIAIVLFEGITNWRIPKLVNRIRKTSEFAPKPENSTRFNMEAEQAFRLAVGASLLATYPLGVDSMLWFFPWFMGFAVLGAGVSGLCPAVASFLWLGFR